MGADDLEQGSIVWAEVSDPNGHIKRRPLIILTATDEIVLDQPIVAVPISTRFPNPAPPNCVELPWQATGHPSTRLRRRSAAVCDWGPIELRSSQIESVQGFLPIRWMTQVLERVAQYRQTDE